MSSVYSVVGSLGDSSGLGRIRKWFGARDGGCFLFNTPEFDFVGGLLERLDDFANSFGVRFEHFCLAVRGEVFLELLEFWQKGLGGRAVFFEGIEASLDSPVFTPLGEFHDFEAKWKALFDPVCCEDFESGDPYAAGEHDPARCRGDNRFVNGGEEWFDFFVGELLVDSADGSPGATVLVLETGADGFLEECFIHAIERFFEELSEDGEAEVALLHGAGIIFGWTSGDHGEEFGENSHGGLSDVREGFGGFDA